MEKIDYCYHTHTTRCGHAYGSEEEYIQVAINNGLKVIGFTDHVFLPGISQPGMRGDYSLLDDYVNTIKGLKEKGYEIVPISELIIKDNYSIDHEGRQISNN